MSSVPDRLLVPQPIDGRHDRLGSSPRGSTAGGHRQASVALKPALVDLGLHRLTRALGMFYVLLVIVVAGSFWLTGLTYEVSTFKAITLLAVFAGWLVHAMQPGRKASDWAIADALMALLLILTFTNLTAPLQYVAVALRQPLVDPWLAAADQALGVYVPSIVEWTRARPGLTQALVVAYNSLLPQFFLPVLVIGLWYRDRDALWEYVVHFHVCAIATVACLAIWPAICAFTYFGFESLLDQARFVRHFDGLRAGSFTVVNGDDIEGLISMPSFHVAGALMVTWAFRRYPVWLGLLIPLNLTMIASTVMTGAHYFVDVLATLALFGLSVGLYYWSPTARWHLR